jgi:hypothetical protein
MYTTWASGWVDLNMVIGMQVKVIVPDLVDRVLVEGAESRRWPRTLTVKWRLRGQGWGRASTSCPLPSRFQPNAPASLLVRY